MTQQQDSAKDKRDIIDWLLSDDDEPYPAHVKRQKTLINIDTDGDDGYDS